MVGVVPSTLHQNVKFVVEEQLISVAAEKDVIATLTTSNLCMEANENVVKCLFQSLEVVDATFFEEGQKITKPRLSKVTMIGAKQTVRKRVKVGLGLRKYL